MLPRIMHIRTLLVLLCFVATGIFLSGCGNSQNAAQLAANDPSVVAFFDGERLTLPEFEKRYARSIGSVTLAADDSLSEYQDFLERYVNFRLKVKAAEDAGYRNTASIQQEIDDYRTSFAKPYLLDKEILNPIVEQLYERSKTIVDASHILLRLEPDATPEVEAAVRARMDAIVDSLNQGTPFEDLALRYSEDPSAQRLQNGQPGVGYKGRLGWFSAGRMVAPFEDAAFETPVGEVSEVFRTRFGYHILYVHDKREAVSDIGLSHIMIRPAAPTPEDSASALSLTRALQDSLAQGVDFAELARRHSADTRSGAQGGVLGYLAFDDARVDATFREAAFEIENVGDVSDIVETPYGYHLIKLTDRKEPASFEEQYDALKKQASRLPRTQAAEKRLAQDTRKMRGEAVDTAFVMSLFEGTPADSVVLQLTNGWFPDSLMTATFATLGDSAYTVERWHQTAKQSQFKKVETVEAQVLEMVNTFLNAQAIDYEAAALEQRDEQFRLIMEEFRDGLLLFKLMEDSVWTAAGQDSAGLRAYFNQHTAEYTFPDRVKVFSLSSSNDSLMRATVTRLDGGLSFDALSNLIAEEEAYAELSLDTLLLEGPSSPPYDMALKLEEGSHTPFLQDQNRTTVFFRRETIPARQKTFEEARPQVVSDYQRVLEEQLIESLRARYNAHTYPERLTRAFSEYRLDAPTASSGG